MVYPGKKHKTYETPNHPWQDTRMAAEFELVKAYGLRNKREVWKAESLLRTYRSDAMDLLAQAASTSDAVLKGAAKTEADQILGRLIRYGILKADSDIDDILGLKAENILERRLQTQVLRLGLAKTIRQARQFITHGHIAIDGRKATVPSMLISIDDESKIGYYGDSPLTSSSHPERPVQVAANVTEGVTLRAAAESMRNNAPKAEGNGRRGGRRK
ncbi:30S ribosomal protein S4 [Methanosarcinaceae archaeon]|nr:30S ribosomal protein S4 [Methanosarcinaceae archaeon]MBQ3620646.1 30S ribosomal protein S4 [Methanosarcinaceae archaeon]